MDGLGLSLVDGSGQGHVDVLVLGHVDVLGLGHVDGLGLGHVDGLGLVMWMGWVISCGQLLLRYLDSGVRSCGQVGLSHVERLY